MAKKYIDENDFEDFGDFEKYYGLDSNDEDEPSELDFDDKIETVFNDDIIDQESE